MEKKNTLLLTVIAVATLLVAVVGATFAYFGSFTTTVDNKAAVNVTTEAAKSSTFVTESASLKLSVPGSQMLKGDGPATAVGTYEGGNETASLNVSLTATDENTKTTCTYIVKYAYDSKSAIYGAAETPVTTNTNGKEFTYTITSDAAGLVVADAYKTADSDFSVFNTAVDEEHAIQVATGTIEVSNSTITQKLSVNVKFYNFPTINQTALAEKTFAGKFYVDSTKVNCGTTAV